MLTSVKRQKKPDNTAKQRTDCDAQRSHKQSGKHTGSITENEPVYTGRGNIWNHEK